MSGAPGLLKDRFTLSARVIEGQIARASVRTTLTYRILPSLRAGVEYNPRARRAGLLANWLAVGETARRPAVIVGTSSDRIGTPSGQSYYATVSKNLKRETRLPIAPYFGVAHGTYESRTRPIGGLSVGFAEWLTGLAIFDGVHVHPTLSAQWSKSVFTFLLVRGKHPGVSYSIVF